MVNSYELQPTHLCQSATRLRKRHVGADKHGQTAEGTPQTKRRYPGATNCQSNIRGDFTSPSVRRSVASDREKLVKPVRRTRGNTAHAWRYLFRGGSGKIEGEIIVLRYFPLLSNLFGEFRRNLLKCLIIPSVSQYLHVL